MRNALIAGFVACSVGIYSAPARAETSISEIDPAGRLSVALDDAGAAAKDLAQQRDDANARVIAVQNDLDQLRASTQPATAPATQTSTQLPTQGAFDWVVSTTGDDSNSGSLAKPLRTISRAAEHVHPGQTVLIQPGVYREAILLTKGGTKDRPITFRAAKPNTVFVDGSDIIRNWTRVEEGVWSTTWGLSFDVGKQPDGSPKRYFGALPPEGFCEMVYQNGRSLKRVMSNAPTAGIRDQVNASPGKGPGTFWIDYGAKRLFVCPFDNADINTVEMSAATRDRLFMPKIVNGTNARADYVKVQNLSFRNACNFPQRGAVTTGNGWSLEDLTIEKVAAVGVWVRGNDVSLLRVVSQNNGQAGIGGSGANNVLIKDCVTRGNNTRRISANWEAGGGKFSRVDNIRFENYLAEANYGPGLWFDIDNKAVSVTNSTFRNNMPVSADWQGAGVMVEISYGPTTIQNCTFDKNVGSGVAIYESTGVTVDGCTFVRTGVGLRELNRKGYTLSNTTIRNNHFTQRTTPAIGTGQGSWTLATLGTKQILIDHNTYDAVTDPSATPIVKWGPTGFMDMTSLRKGLNVETTP